MYKRKSIASRVANRRKYVVRRNPASMRATSYSRVPRFLPPSPTMLRCRRSVFYSQITTSTSLETLGVYTFQLSDLVNYTEFTNLFDEYKINSVCLKFFPSLTAKVSQFTNGVLVTAIDKNDGNATGSVNELLQHDDCIVVDLCQNNTFIIDNPRMNVSSQTATTPTFAGQTSMSGWVNNTTPTVQHYGFRWAIPATTAAAMNINVLAIFDVSFRSTK